jgi:hypothetical protein
MSTFSQQSEERLNTCHPDIQKVLRAAIKVVDFTILCGHRTKTEQDALYAQTPKVTNVAWPNSNHNKSRGKDGVINYNLADAVDIAPYPVAWPDPLKQTTKEYTRRIGAFFYLAGVLMATAAEQGVSLQWGGTFKSFFDGPHFERVM